MPTPDGGVVLRWRKDGGKLRYQTFVPAGYQVNATSLGGLEIVREP